MSLSLSLFRSLYLSLYWSLFIYPSLSHTLFHSVMHSYIIANSVQPASIIDSSTHADQHICHVRVTILPNGLPFNLFPLQFAMSFNFPPTFSPTACLVFLSFVCSFFYLFSFRTGDVRVIMHFRNYFSCTHFYNFPSCRYGSHQHFADPNATAINPEIVKLAHLDWP